VSAPFLLLLDKDESTQEEMKSDIRLYGENRVHYLSRREIENYMLDPKAILKLLRAKAEKYGRSEDLIKRLKEMTENDISKKMNGLIKEGHLQHKVRMLRFLKKLTPLRFIPYKDMSRLIEESRDKNIDYIIKALLLKFYEKVSQQREEELSKTLEKVTEDLNKEWDDNKLLLCPGKDLFALINGWTEEAFQITFSTKEVIDYLDRVDEDIVHLINKILVSGKELEAQSESKVVA